VGVLGDNWISANNDDKTRKRPLAALNLHINHIVLTTYFSDRMEMLEKLMPLNAPAPTNLLLLLIEIHLQIYYHCIPRKRIIHVAYPRCITQFIFEFEHGWDPEHHIGSVQDWLGVNGVSDNHNLDDFMYDSVQESECCN
jgi:hypothetical protein